MSTEIVVGTQIQRVIPEEHLPDAVLTGVIQALFRDEGIPESINEKLLKSIGLRAEHMYHYAAAGNYMHGLPSSQMMSMTAARAETETLLMNLEASEIYLDYCRLSKPNYLHQAWMKLVSEYGYDSVTNRVSREAVVAATGLYIPPETYVEMFLQDIVLVVPKYKYPTFEPGVIDLWGTPPNAGKTTHRLSASFDNLSIRAGTPIRVRNDISTEYIELQFSFARPYAEIEHADSEFPKGSLKVVTVILGPEDFPLNTAKQYFQVAYKVGELKKWWVYEAGSGAYPALDEIALAPPKLNGTYFPFIYFRYDKVSELEDKSSATYKAGKKLTEYLGLDYDDIGEAINENPDIEDVIQAMMVFGVDPESKHEFDKEYLYRYFDVLYNSQDSKFKVNSATNDYRRMYSSNYSDMTDGWNNVNIDISDNRFKMRFKAKGLFKSAKAGRIAKVGGYNSGKGTVEYPVRYTEWDEGYFLVEALKEVPYYYYQYQVTNNLYYEIQVVGLEMQYYVYGEHLTTSNELKNILLVPLDRSLIEDFSISKKETIYSRALYFVFNSMQEIKLRWYQTGLGQLVLAIVSVFVTWLIGGADGGSLLAAVMAAGVTSVTLAIIIAGIVQFAINNLIMGTLTMAADILGADGAIVAAVLMVVAALYGMYRAGTANVPWAQQMLTASNGLIQQGYAQAVEDLMGEQQEFMEWATDAQKDLDEVRRTLTHTNRMNPFVIFGETPSEYYNRTIHAGNTGAMSIQAVSSYVSDSLKLPRTHETLSWV